MKALANDRRIVIKKAGKGLCVVVWDLNDYTKEAEKQLSDENIFKDINLKGKILQELWGYILLILWRQDLRL